MMLAKASPRSLFTVFIPLMLLALILQIIRLPEIVENYRPNLMILILLYFCMLDQSRVNVEIGWLFGLLFDFLSGAPLGINAMLYASQLYLVISQFRRFAQYQWWQQAIIIGLVNLLVNIIGFWIEHILGVSVYQSNFLMHALSVACLWPFMLMLCTLLCQVFRVTIRDNETNV